MHKLTTKDLHNNFGIAITVAELSIACNEIRNLISQILVVPLTNRFSYYTVLFEVIFQIELKTEIC